MSNEVAAGKSQTISYSDRVKLAIISIVHHRFGPRSETHLPVSRLRMHYVLYLADLEWYRQHGGTYLGVWVYANNGPMLQDFGKALADLDGLEIAGKGPSGYKEYSPGKFNRYKTWQMDQRFEQILLDTKRQCYFNTAGLIKKIVYASLPMQGACLGDCLFA